MAMDFARKFAIGQLPPRRAVDCEVDHRGEKISEDLDNSRVSSKSLSLAEFCGILYVSGPKFLARNFRLPRRSACLAVGGRPVR